MTEQVISPIARTFNGTRFRSTSEALWAMLLKDAGIDASYQPIFVADPSNDEFGWLVDLGIEFNGKTIYIEVKHCGKLGFDGFGPVERYEMALLPPYNADEVWLVLSKPDFKSDGSALWGWKLTAYDDIEEELDLGFISMELRNWINAVTTWRMYWQDLVDMEENKEATINQLPFAF